MTLNLDKSAWKRVAFGDVVRNVNETVRDLEAAGIDRIIAMEHMDPGELKVSRWGSTDDGTTFTRRVKPGQTLFGKRRAYQRKVAYAEFDAICSGDIYTFEADETQLLGDLLPFLVQSNGFFEHALGTSAGSLSPRTNWRDLKEFQFDLPPLNEQKRIADLVWAIERSRVAHEELVATAGRTASIWLDDVLGQWGTITPLGQVVSGIVDCAHKTAPTDDSDFARVIGTPDVRNGRVLLESARPISEETFHAWTERATPRPGDLVFTREAPAGEVGIIPRGHPVCLGQRTVLIQPHDIGEGFLVWAVLRSAGVQSLIRLKSAGSTVPHLNVSDIRSLPVPWPTSPEGKRAVRRTVDATQGLAEAVHVEAQAATALRESLLAEIFGGN